MSPAVHVSTVPHLGTTQTALLLCPMSSPVSWRWKPVKGFRMMASAEAPALAEADPPLTKCFRLQQGLTYALK